MSILRIFTTPRARLGLAIKALFFIGLAILFDSRADAEESDNRVSKFVLEYELDEGEWAYVMEHDSCTNALLSARNGKMYDPRMSKYGKTGWIIFFGESKDSSENVCLMVRMNISGDYAPIEFSSAYKRMESAIYSTGSRISKYWNSRSRLWIVVPNNSSPKDSSGFRSVLLL